jgi:hypothetical protein
MIIEQTETPCTIDMTPTWSAILPAMLAVYETGDFEARAVVTQELQSMARAADLAVTMRKAMQGK